MLGWSRQRLADEAGVSPVTLADFETSKRRPYARTLADIQGALETAGIIFIPEGQPSQDGGAGVRLKAGD